jgi:UDP-N-acetylglucosamine 2-epimerase (non-hydrolysing)
MHPFTILVVFGTRPEAIKMAPVVRELRATPDIRTVVCVTSQHREMLDQVLNVFGIHPDHDLNVMVPRQGLGELTARVLARLESVLASERPQLVLVQGDTTTTFVASLAAFYQQIPVGHVEAGLRTHNRYSPFPEEMNRCLTTRLASVHLAPTNRNKAALVGEGIPERDIVVTGNTVIDALLMVRDRAIPHGIARDRDRRLIVVTAHRRENFGAPMRGMLRALKAIAARWPDVEIVYPAHPNPEVRRAIADEIGARGAVRIVEPLSYGPFVTLLDEATLILTDSGGIQEEAPALGKPVLVMRDETERPEAIEAGVARLVGTDERRIVEETARLLDDPVWYRQMARGASPYGDGHAAARIVTAIGRSLEAASRTS